MPKSRNRKNHKKKAKAYGQRVKVANAQERFKRLEEMNAKFQEEQSSKKQQTGELITDSDIDVGVDVDVDDMDIDVDMDLDLDDVEVVSNDDSEKEDVKDK